MILPIVAYGSSILRNVGKEITPDYPELNKLIDNMWETLKASNGIGLAAPQVNKDIRLFIVDSKLVFDSMDEAEIIESGYPDAPGIHQVFINAKIIHYSEQTGPYNEGCLSIPNIHEDVTRPLEITIKYVDENFEPHTDTFKGISARIIQHEYDHTEGKLFVDYLKPLHKKMMQGKLKNISKRKAKISYKMIYPQ